jgi:methionyl-tRNA formyltransferase
MDMLFIGEGSLYSSMAASYVSERIPGARVVLWDHGQPMPQLGEWTGDWIVCFKADLILPSTLLSRARMGAINIHPAPPRYRGIGGYVYAIYNEDDSFGITCHHIVERIDFGSIITVDEFPIFPSDTTSTLQHRAASRCLLRLYDLIEQIISGLPMPASERTWIGPLYTRKKLDVFLAQVQEDHPDHDHRCLK